MKNKTLTIVFADVQGFTSRTGRQTREQNQLFISEIQKFVKKHAKEKGGTLVKTMGDGFLLTFDSPTDAVACGQHMQKEIQHRNANIMDPNKFIRFRIGICTGEVTVDDDNDVHGDAVNIAARIQSFASPNDVYIGEATYLAMNKSEINASDLGPQKFKNVVQEVRVYKVSDKPEPPTEAVKPPPVVNKTYIILGVGIVGILVFGLLNGIFNPKYVKVTNKQPVDKLPRQENLAPFLELVDEFEYNKQFAEAMETLDKYIAKEPEKELREKALIRRKDLAQQAEEARKQKEALERQAEEERVRRLELERQAEEDRWERQKLEQQALEARKQRQELERQAEEDRKRRQELEFRAQEERLRRQEQERKEQEVRNVSAAESLVTIENSLKEPERDLKQLLQEGKYDEVIMIADEQIRENPNSHQVYVLAGEAFFKKGDYYQAEQYFQDAIDLSPNNSIAYQKLSAVYEQSGKINDAIRILRKLINIESQEYVRVKMRQQIERLERLL